MAQYKKSKFSDKTFQKLKKKKYKKSTTLLNKPKNRKINRRKEKPFKAIAKKLFPKNASVNKKKIPATKKIFAVSFGIFLLIAYLLFFTEFLYIKTINVYEGEAESENTQIRKIIEPLRGKNILLIKPEIVEQTLKDQIENLSELKIQKRFPSTINLHFAKFQKVANLTNFIGPQRVKKNFIINETGVLMEKDVVNPNLPFVSIQSSKGFDLGDQVVSRETLNYILEARSEFEEKFNMKVIEVEYLTKAREVHLTSERNFEVWLDLQVSYKEQLSKLKSAIPKIDIYQDSLQYIDLRIQSAQGQKIIYRKN